MGGNIGNNENEKCLPVESEYILAQLIQSPAPRIADATYLLCPEMPVLRDIGRPPPPRQPPYGDGSKHNSKDGDRGDPDVNKTWREIVPDGAQRAPTFLVAAKRLLRVASSREVAAA